MSPQVPTVPSKEEIRLLPPFAGLGLDRIVLVTSTAQAEKAGAELGKYRIWGFDTESKPTFQKGEISDGPHLLQLATLEKTWVIQLHNADCATAVAQWLMWPNVIKVGFGVREDCKRITRKLGVVSANVFDLDNVFRERGFQKTVGARSAVAILFNQRFAKSESAQKSNWAAPKLSPNQIVYAANDAYVALRVYLALFPGAEHALDRL